MTVPFLDLAATNDPVRRDILRDLDRLASASRFTLGASVQGFEEAWAHYCGARFCVGVGSGTDALTLALRAMNDEWLDVAVPAMTFQATWEAVTLAGLFPAPVDVGRPAHIPVDLYGCPADTDDGTLLVDASQSHGVHHASVTATYSFFPTKNLGAWGDAGAVVTDDEGLADEVRALRTHGGVLRSQHNSIGTTSRLDAVQATVLLRKLPLLDGWNTQRREAAMHYSYALHDLDWIRLPDWHDNHVWHLYVVTTRHRDDLQAHLARCGVETAVHYPVPPHLTPAYAHLGYERGDFPNAERLASEGLSLPLWPGITEGQQSRVIDALLTFTPA